jgi:hypothetical protein
VLGLEILGQFSDHDGYDGVFLGLPELDWQLEFTQSAKPAEHQFDDDDILVFYPADNNQFAMIIQNLEKQGIPQHTPVNPYWRDNSVMVKDPDGYPVILYKSN